MLCWREAQSFGGFCFVLDSLTIYTNLFCIFEGMDVKPVLIDCCPSQERTINYNNFGIIRHFSVHL